MNEWNEDIEDFDITLGFSQQKHLKNQNSDAVSESVEAKYNDGYFRRIESRSRPPILRSKDGGIVGYRVPAVLVSEDLSHIQGLEKWVEEFRSTLPRQFDEKRNVECVRRYGHWVKYNEGGQLKETGDYRQDGLVARKFFEYTSSCPLYQVGMTRHSRATLSLGKSAISKVRIRSNFHVA
jgi:hypothetical protein